LIFFQLELNGLLKLIKHGSNVSHFLLFAGLKGVGQKLEPVF